MTTSLTENMRSLLNKLQEFRQLNCGYDSITRTILFTLTDLQALSKAFNLTLTGVGAYATGDDWSQVHNILTTAGIPAAKFKGKLRVSAPYVMGIKVQDEETKSQISQVLNISCTEVKTSQPVTSCAWNPSTHQLLFTMQDLNKFAQNWKIPRVNMHDNLAVTNACLSAMIHIMDSAGITPDKFRGRMRLAPPHVLGFDILDPTIKDKIMTILKLEC
jgi:hypothetical protein